MNENLLKLLDKLLKDPEILEQFSNQNSIDELYTFCISVVSGYGFEEFKAFLEILSKIRDYSQNKNKISYDDLENVAGGFGMPTKMTSAWMGSLLLLSGCGAGAKGLSYDNNNQSKNVSISENQNYKNNSKSDSNTENDEESNFKKVSDIAKKFTNSNDNNSNFSNINQNNNNENKNENFKLSITNFPTASNISYGQSLAESTLLGGKANTGGTFSWVSPSFRPNVGRQNFQVKFTPNDSDLKPEIIEVSINVTKAKPIISSWPDFAQIVDKEVFFSGGQTNVDGSFSLGNPTPNLTSGQYTKIVNFIPSDPQNYETVSKKITLGVSNLNIRISWPTASELTYGQKLSDVKLSGGTSSIAGKFEWDSSYNNPKPDAGTRGYRLIFRPHNTQRYKPFYKYITVKINKATPTLACKPTASPIVYGQTLNKSNIIGGKFSVDGTFSWHKGRRSRPTAGLHLQKVIFTPNDTKNYKSVPINVLLTVKKAPTSFLSTPSASSIIYGQTLKYSHISDIVTNVEGKVYWENPNEELNAGTHIKTLIFKPLDSDNYDHTKINIQVNVNKAAVKIEKTNFESEYTEGMTLNDLKLPKGWSWNTPNVRLNEIGQFRFGVTYSGDENHRSSKAIVTVKINKARPRLSLPKITYNENIRLKNIKLPHGWHWENENETPNPYKATYKARFNAHEAGTNFYHSGNNINVKLDVQKATPNIVSWAQLTSQVTYGDNLKAVRLEGGKSQIKGRFHLVGNTYELGAGKHICKLVFTPENKNYREVSTEIPITILKNMNPAESPRKINYNNAKISDTSIAFEFEKENEHEPMEFSKDGGKTWQDSPIFENLAPKTQYHFAHRYKDTKSRCAGKIGMILDISTKDSAPPAPRAPKISEYTNHAIKLKKSSNLEFSINGGKTWQSSPEFKKLSGSTEYKIIARVKENSKHVAGKISEPLVIKTRSWLGNIWHKIIS